MTIGEVDFEDRFMHSQNITNKPTSTQTASFVFLGLFLILMTIVLMNLLVCIKIRNFSVTFNSASRMHKCKSTMFYHKRSSPIGFTTHYLFDIWISC